MSRHWKHVNAFRLLTVSLLGAVSAVTVSQLPAQETGRSESSQEFDRAWIADSTLWKPFLVSGGMPLREALNQELVYPETKLLVMEHEKGRLALVTDQMAYHHVAQGDIAGEPWMVSF